ncbi:type A2 lantipeptide [Nostoc sp. CENA67]|uniref:Type A2 lantipeptide n=1 Tax=Amazonocrinis nigriterrae CENA67 TaxID=2794033 RepID=A0A8J7LBB3_9NOST|nr:type A2 lantipeptide [Amazonocrinis nigriterrae]MBH8563496.1 type A2 lantipeptide [Amazonocrinis nigriterrae CENA67]
MSNQNEKLDPKENSEQIGINENGELVVNDPQLEQALQELTTEELEEIAGGGVNGSCPQINGKCAVQDLTDS